MIGRDGDSEDDIALAGEYALSVLGDEALEEVERRMAREPRLAALVRDWQEELARLAEEVSDVQPPASVLRGIEAQLFGAARDGAVSGWLRRLLLPAAVATAVTVGAIYLAPPGLFGPDPSIPFEVAAEDGTLVFAAVLDPPTHVLTLSRVSGDVAPGRAQELWLIAEDAPAPISLGLLEEPTTAIFVEEDLRPLFPGATFAVSDEPPGGSPTGAPTGAVLAAGRLIIP